VVLTVVNVLVLVVVGFSGFGNTTVLVVVVLVVVVMVVVVMVVVVMVVNVLW